MIVQFDLNQCYKPGDNAMTWIREIDQNDVTPVYVLRRLAASPDVELRMAVADHSNASEEVLMLLADDENSDVRYAIAENHNIGHNVLDKLSADNNPYVAHRAKTTLARVRTGEVWCFGTKAAAS